MKMVPVTLNFFKSQWRTLANAHPLARGVLSYAVLWPSGSLIQQTIEGKNLKTYDWQRCLRFSIFGALYVAPSLYCWVRLSTAMWPQTNLRIGLVKAATEQISYGPFACASFFIGMSLLEFKTFDQALKEVQEKFLPTFKVGLCVWPILQTINFSMIPERNRVVYVSICSLIWTSYLAYVKSKELTEEDVKSKELIEEDVVERQVEAVLKTFSTRQILPQ